jgi:hypothetical protein
MNMGILLIVILLSAIVIVPKVSADEKNITINITAPEEGDEFYIDVVPAYIEVHGTIDAPGGIQNVSITNGLTDTYGEVVCGTHLGTHFDISCKILITDHVVIRVTDESGLVASERRNFTVYAGPPGPGTIWVTGWVIDMNGQPVSNASIIFETIGERYTITATTKSGADGSYKMKKALVDFQKITVQKEGYQTAIREVRFKPLYNDLNLTLTPQGKPVPGFGFGIGVSAIIIGLFLITVRKR